MRVKTLQQLLLLACLGHDRLIRRSDGAEEEVGRDPRGNMRSMSQAFAMLPAAQHSLPGPPPVALRTAAPFLPLIKANRRGNNNLNNVRSRLVTTHTHT